ncbi:hypothetical protein HDK64DRAFT_126353 [Phyllosticta capitalensis]|uniref:Uncharacterized protein n=1 Tax=Phyllosticta capitalensis TaxID=121624 RepID=A0ABR1YJD6_9PEZI
MSGERSIFEKRSIVAQASTSNSWCPCSLVILQKDTSQGIISISTQASFNDDQHPLLLQLSPQNLVAMDLSYNSQVPALIQTQLENAVPRSHRGQFLIMTLALDATGTLLLPQAARGCTSSPKDREKVQAFQEICRATSIRLYIQAHGIKAGQKAALDEFKRLVIDRKLGPLPHNIGGRYGGMREADCDILDVKDDPPPYEPSSKRRRDGKSVATPESPDADCNLVSPSTSQTPAKRTRHVNEKPKDEQDAPRRNLEKSPDLAQAITDRLQEQLPGMLQQALQNLLPGMMRRLAQEVIEDMAHDACGTTLRKTLEPTISGLFEKWVDDNDPIDGLADFAESQIHEMREDAILEIKSAAEDGVRVVEEAERDAAERLAASYFQYEYDLEETVEKDVSESHSLQRVCSARAGSTSSSGDSLRFRRRRNPSEKGAPRPHDEPAEMDRPQHTLYVDTATEEISSVANCTQDDDNVAAAATATNRPATAPPELGISQDLGWKQHQPSLSPTEVDSETSVTGSEA